MPPRARRAKGNIVLTLDGQNAARTLLNLVQSMPSTIQAKGKTAVERGEQKEREFYAAVFEGPPLGGKLELTQARHVSRIMAGDPSRGAMSVETEEDVRPGSHLVFLTRSDHPRPATSEKGFNLLSIPASYSAPQAVEGAPATGESVVVLKDVFLAASENGVVVSRKGGGCWVCGVEGAVARVR